MDHRARLVTHAAATIGAGSKSFAAASRLFDRATRERVWLLYAWCRRCDDLIDGQDLGGAMRDQASVTQRMEEVRERTARAFSGIETGDPAFDCLAVVARETGLTPAMADDVLAGFTLDATGWQPRNETDLMRYCWHVAGAVGVMMAVVMGVDPDDAETLERAGDLGMAFQLANIARDLAEDNAAQRCYLPAEWLAEADIPPGEELKPPYRNALAVMARRLCRIATAHECSARIGARRLRLRQRWAILAAAGIYGEIARIVTRRGAAAWDRRAVVDKKRKLWWIARSAVQAFLPAMPGLYHGARLRRYSRRDFTA